MRPRLLPHLAEEFINLYKYNTHKVTFGKYRLGTEATLSKCRRNEE